MNRTYKFTLPIGDYFDEGHGKYECFLVESNKPIDAICEAHFRIKETTGIDLNCVCSEKGEDNYTPAVCQRLYELGFLSSGEPDSEWVVSTEEMAELWLFLLKESDPELELAIIEEDPIPMLCSSADPKGRTVGIVGYGVF